MPSILYSYTAPLGFMLAFTLLVLAGLMLWNMPSERRAIGSNVGALTHAARKRRWYAAFTAAFLFAYAIGILVMSFHLVLFHGRYNLHPVNNDGDLVPVSSSGGVFALGIILLAAAFVGLVVTVLLHQVKHVAITLLVLAATFTMFSEVTCYRPGAPSFLWKNMWATGWIATWVFGLGAVAVVAKELWLKRTKSRKNLGVTSLRDARNS
jgi:hypothetical protein